MSDSDQHASSLWRLLTEEIRSEQMAEVRQLLAWLQRQMPGIVKVPPVLNFIPDANCILKELDYLCRRRRGAGLTALQEVVDAGSARLFAPFELEGELFENIPPFARETRFSSESYFTAWSEYKKRIHFFALPVRGTVSLSDPDDVYLFDAINVVGADAIISDDNIVLTKGPAVKPTVIHGQLRRLTREEAVRRTLALQGIMVVLVAGKGLEGLVRLCIRRPKIGIPALLGAAGVLLLVDRWQMRSSGHSVIRDAWLAIKAEAGSFLDALGDLTRSAQTNLADVERELGPRTPRTLDQFIGAALITANGPMPEKALIDAIVLDGYDAWARERAVDESMGQWNARCWASFVGDLRERLRSHALLRQTEQGWVSSLVPTFQSRALVLGGPKRDAATSQPADARTGTKKRPQASAPVRSQRRPRAAGRARTGERRPRGGA